MSKFNLTVNSDVCEGAFEIYKCGRDQAPKLFNLFVGEKQASLFRF
jgi:hypothetical protein